MPAVDAYGREFSVKDACACVGRGWRDVVAKCWRACYRNNVEILQIKEKFGGLRFYVGSAPDDVLRLIEQMEEESYTICEECGDDGKPIEKNGWIKTLCENCAK